jgi:hypothetical protein
VVELGGALGDLNVQQLQILDFTKQSHKDGIEVNSEEALRSNWCILSNK